MNDSNPVFLQRNQAFDQMSRLLAGYRRDLALQNGEFRLRGAGYAFDIAHWSLMNENGKTDRRRTALYGRSGRRTQALDAQYDPVAIAHVRSGHRRRQRRFLSGFRQFDGRDDFVSDAQLLRCLVRCAVQSVVDEAHVALQRLRIELEALGEAHCGRCGRNGHLAHRVAALHRRHRMRLLIHAEGAAPHLIAHRREIVRKRTAPKTNQRFHYQEISIQFQFFHIIIR